jgi:hypothetical protein
LRLAENLTQFTGLEARVAPAALVAPVVPVALVVPVVPTRKTQR